LNFKQFYALNLNLILASSRCHHSC